MPKFRWHTLPMGAMHRFKEYRFEDLTPQGLMYQMHKQDFKLLHDGYSTGRKKSLTAQRAYAKLIRAFWRHVLDRLIDGDRLIISKDLSMYIGMEAENVNHFHVNNRRKPYLRRRRGIILNGIFHNYYFRMPYRRYREVKDRIRNGQSYIT